MTESLHFYTRPDNISAKKLPGKVALITGGTSGIGKATALLFAAEGAAVAFTGRRADKGAALVAEIEAAGGTAAYIPADHTKEQDCQQAVDATIQRFGRVDILFNNAGIVLDGTAESTSEADWALTLDLNVTAVWRMSRFVLPHMRANGGGAIVNNASDWGLVGASGFVAYCASKGAVIQMTRAMALDHAGENIRVNAVCPGDTLVERWLESGQFDGLSQVERILAIEEGAKRLPIGRVANVYEIAKAVLFLASDDSTYITGTALVVDGGNTAR